MTLNEYQDRAMTTCMESSDNFSYMFLNLIGEVGEFASKVAKAIRKEKCHIGGYNSENQLCRDEVSAEFERALMLEAGDCAWCLVGLCKVMGWTFEEVCQANLDKLQIRDANHTIDGNGDGVTKEERACR